MTDISLERTHSQTLCATTNVFMYYKVQHRLIVFLPQWLLCVSTVLSLGRVSHSWEHKLFRKTSMSHGSHNCPELHRE